VDHFSRAKKNILRTPSILNAIVEQIHPDIMAKFVYLIFDFLLIICFLQFRSHQSNFVIFPPKLEGCSVIDLGCGVGRDVFILSKLVDENGRVIGIDSEKDQVSCQILFLIENDRFSKVTAGFMYEE
jgi:SAM-dependent methyltransferase